MAVRDILLLGNPLLYRVSSPVKKNELEGIRDIVADLRDTMAAFRERYGVGRAIAAPQIGEMKRLIYMDTGEPLVFINPRLSGKSDSMMELWDDCMSFPGLLVKVRRHRSCWIEFMDLKGRNREMKLEDDLSELLQHECDHLVGILAVMKAVDSGSFALGSEREHIK